jgi:hypothetical protein
MYMYDKKAPKKITHIYFKSLKASSVLKRLYIYRQFFHSKTPRARVVTKIIQEYFKSRGLHSLNTLLEIKVLWEKTRFFT